MFTYAGAPTNTGYLASAKVYYCKIWDGDTLIRDFQPVVNDDGEIGLYDVVNAQFYGNIGTGTFSYQSKDAEYLIQTTTLTGIADAIREKNGSTGAISVCDMAQSIKDIEASTGSENLEKDILEGTLLKYTNSSVTSLRIHALRLCESLVSVNLPSCTIVNNYALANCTALTSADLPVCTSVGNYAFQACTALVSVNIPACTYIGNYAFSGCTALTSADLPVCTSVGNGAFYNCSALTSVNLQVCTSIGNSAFYNCSALTSVNLPSCTYIGNSAFRGCNMLTSLVLPGSTVVSLGGNSVFYYTPMSSYALMNKYGSIYVPSSLVTSYKAAQYWSVYSARITSIVG
jgi:hypothetical protein